MGADEDVMDADWEAAEEIWREREMDNGAKVFVARY
jgi:hypothetical protein